MTEQTVNDKLQDVAEAVAREKAAFQETITQLKTDLEAARRGDLVALAALGSQVDNLTTKIKALDDNRDGLWREVQWRRELAGDKGGFRAEMLDPRKAVAAPVPVRKLTDLRVDQSFSIGKQPKAAQPYLERIEKLMTAEAKVDAKTVTASMNGPTVAILGGYKERIGRDTGYFTLPLRVIARMTGAPYSRDTSRRLLRALKPQLTVESHGLRGLQEDAKTKEGNDFNQKEELLAHGEIACEMEDLYDNLGDNAEDDALFRFYLDYLLNDYEAKWLKRYKVRLPEHRTLHASLQKVRYCLRLHKFTNDEWYKSEAEKLAPLIREELQYVTVKGIEYVATTWRVRALEPVASKSDAEYFHMSVYFHMDVMQIVDLALSGVSEFADERLLKALANTLEAMIVDVTYTNRDGTTGKGAMYSDAGAFMGMRLNEREQSSRAIKLGDRVYRQGPWSAGYFKPGSALLNYGSSLILPWGSGGLRKRYEDVYKATDTDPSHLTVPVAFVFAELWKAGEYKL